MCGGSRPLTEDGCGGREKGHAPFPPRGITRGAGDRTAADRRRVQPASLAGARAYRPEPCYPAVVAVSETPINDFGILIAYLLPGFTALWSATYLSSPMRSWFGTTPPDGPTVGGFLFLTLASVASGLTVSTLRWLVIDTLFHRTGIRPQRWDFSMLRESANAFGIIVDHYYRYYQFQANMLVSLFLIFAARRWSQGFIPGVVDSTDVGILAVMALFVAGSRDSLRRYYTRGGQLLRPPLEQARIGGPEERPRGAQRIPSESSEMSDRSS